MTALKKDFLNAFGTHSNIKSIKLSHIESCLEVQVVNADRVNVDEETLNHLGLSRVTSHDYHYGLFLVRFKELIAAIWAYEALRTDR